MATIEEEQAGRRVEGEPGPQVGEGRRIPPRVVVVGAGVSGCACAAALASEGLHVTLVNSAMDRVGLPAYGPDMIGATEGWREVDEVFHGLPEALRRVWMQAATSPVSGEAVLNIDRRKLSIETKMALERIPGLEFRQGFVTDLRLVTGDDDPQGAKWGIDGTASDASAAQRTRRRRVEVETIFGEIFKADAVVVAVGLSLGGSIDTGTGSVHAGRYGEPESEGLRAALEALGAEFRETVLEVGPRVSARSAAELGWLTDSGVARDGAEDGRQSPQADAQGELLAEEPAERRVQPGAEPRVEPRIYTLSESLLLPPASDLGPGSWPAGYPPAPHWEADLVVKRMVMALNAAQRDGAGGLPALSPDGAAMAEVYLSPGSAFAAEMSAVSGDGAAPMASRVALTARGVAVVGLGDAGSMFCGGEQGMVWVVGRSAGARDYSASLSSGLRSARDIACSLDRPAVAHTLMTAAGGPEGGA